MKRKPWRKYLLKEELKHLKEINVRTKKDFIETNEAHNKRRIGAGALEPCYQCKTIANKLGLNVAARGKLVVVPAAEELKTKYQAVRLVNNNKPRKEASSMNIGNIKCPILRRLCLCSIIVPCVLVVMVTETCQKLKFSFEAGCETFADIWEGYNGRPKGFD
jgi:hypothetical protein